MGVSEYIIQKLYNQDKDFIVNSRIDKILKINNKNFAFVIYNKGLSKTLLFSLEPNLPIYLLGDSLVSFVEENSGFITILKKYLEFGTIVDFEKVENDRIIKLKVRKRLPTYIYEISTLVFEMIPMRANIILLDDNEKIIDAFHKSEGFEDKFAICKGLKYHIQSVASKKINITDDMESIRLKVSRKEYDYLSKLSEEEFLNVKQIMCDVDTFYLSKNDISALKISDSRCLKKDELLAAVLSQKEKEGRDNHFVHVINFVQKKCLSLEKKLRNLHDDLIKCENSSLYKDYGSLLFYGSTEYNKGDEKVVIEGKTIPLKRDLNLHDNALLYFKKYKKAKSGIEQIQNQIALTEKELAYFEELKSQITFADSEDYKQIITQLENDNYFKKQKVIKKHKEEKVFNPHIIVYQDVKIGYGLSSFQNDYLTFTLAHKEDIFLHIKDYHGPHVIIFNDNPNEDVMLFACEICLYFAAKNTGDVYYARRKHIKKIPAKTGMVELNEYKEVHIVSIRESTLEVLNKTK